MGMSQTIHDFIRTCPLVNDEMEVRFYRMGTGEDAAEQILKQYMDSSVRAVSFHLIGKEDFAFDEESSIEHSAFYEEFSEWIDEQNEQKHFPALTEGKEAMKLECVSAGYLMSQDTETARYGIQIKLTYIKKGERL